MVPPRHASKLFALLLTGCMTFVVSGVTTFINLGFPPGVFARWMQAWLPTWAIAFPTMMVLRPLVQRATDALVKR